MKNVAIVGAGIAGLSAGIYLRQSGFDTTIYESHSIPGGASTSWRRKGYYFEGGLHWLTGSSPDTQLNRLWREVGALDDTVDIQNRDPFFAYEMEGKRANLYRDVKTLREHLTALSPADRKEIRRFCADVEKFTRVKMPAMDLPKLKAKYPVKFPLSALLAMLPAMPRMKYYSSISAKEFGEKFQSPQIRSLFSSMIGEEFSANGVLFTIATLASGDGGYPAGGSVAMAQRMANYYESLGGKVLYRTPVERVIVERGAATGVRVAGEAVSYDGVVVTKDTLSAIDTLFDEPIHEPWAEKMRRVTTPVLNVFVGIGVQADLSDLPRSITFPVSEPITVGNIRHDSIGFNHYAGFAGYAPEGCTALTTALLGDSYDFWSRCRENGTYEAEKQKLAEAVIRELVKKYPQIDGKIAVWDVATPLTYERYLGSYKGSWMTLTKKGEENARYPGKPESIGNLYFAGQRLISPGGLPVALMTGRTAAQHICLDTDTVFQGEL
ncbi:MAG: NAD(P)/FAD-dependent oxidoreductase [Clostridiales bacterium]|nr:NAD(P)/FAD-dependent oxidoreductase [Clostridiales bacterium]